MAYIRVKNEEFKVETLSYIEDGKVDVMVWNTWRCDVHRLKVYYRHERTWDDHMGNTPCGYYVNLPLPYGCGKKRYYLEYR